MYLDIRDKCIVLNIELTILDKNHCLSIFDCYTDYDN